MELSSIISDYLEYNENNECPRNYHIWSFLSLMSAMVGRRTRISLKAENQKAYFEVLCNLYICLVGPQGNRKSVAKDLVLDLLLELDPTYPVSASIMSREAIADYLSEEKGKEQERFYKSHSGYNTPYRPFAMFVNEMSNFSSVNTTAMIEFLTDIYDRKVYNTVTIRGGRVTIPNPFFTLIGCTVPDWIMENLKQRIITGGFCRRMIWVYETEHKRISFPSVTPYGECALGRVRTYLQSLRDAQLKDEFVWTPAARTFYSIWYESLQPPPDPIMAGFYESKHIQLLKIGMLISLTESFNCVLDVTHLELGLSMLDALEENMPRLSEGVGRNELAAPTVRTLETIRMTGGIIPDKDLRKIMWKNFQGKEGEDTLNYLKRTEQLFEVWKKVGEINRLCLANKDWVDENRKLLKIVQGQLHQNEGS